MRRGGKSYGQDLECPVSLPTTKKEKDSECRRVCYIREIPELAEWEGKEGGFTTENGHAGDKTSGRGWVKHIGFINEWIMDKVQWWMKQINFIDGWKRTLIDERSI